MRKTEAINWVSEEVAMQRLGYTKESLRILTRNEKRKTLPIRTSKPNRKTVLYSGNDIENYILERMYA